MEICTTIPCYCTGCPYKANCTLDSQELMEDALALLKEQEPRVLDWDEIKNYSVVYGEFKGFKKIYPLIISLDDKGRTLSWSPYINTSDEFLLLVDSEEDRKNTRCWNKEPTEEQRQTVKWNETAQDVETKTL